MAKKTPATKKPAKPVMPKGKAAPFTKAPTGMSGGSVSGSKKDKMC